MEAVAAGNIKMRLIINKIRMTKKINWIIGGVVLLLLISFVAVWKWPSKMIAVLPKEVTSILPSTEYTFKADYTGPAIFSLKFPTVYLDSIGINGHFLYIMDSGNFNAEPSKYSVDSSAGDGLKLIYFKAEIKDKCNIEQKLLGNLSRSGLQECYFADMEFNNPENTNVKKIVRSTERNIVIASYPKSREKEFVKIIDSIEMLDK